MLVDRRALMVAAALVGPAATSASLPTAAAHTAGECRVDRQEDRCEAWSRVFDDRTIRPPRRSDQFVTATATTDDTVYIALKNVALDPDDPYSATGSWVVLAYEAATGDLVWRAERRTRVYDMPLDIAVAPDGRTVYATGAAYDGFPVSASDSRVVTVSYDASTGAEIWAREWDNLPNATDNGKVISVGPDGREVYVGGITTATAGDLDYLLLGYDTKHGRESWATTYAGPGGNGSDVLYDIAVDPTGRLLYATGSSNSEHDYDLDYTTLALRTARGKPGSLAWINRYDGVGMHKPDRARAITVSPEGGTVAVTGNSYVANPDGSTNYDMATVAYSRGGEQLWENRYDGAGSGIAYDSGTALVAAHGRVVITGQSAGQSQDDLDVATIAYDVLTGNQQWVHREGQRRTSQLPGHIVASPDGSMFYMLSTARPAVPYTALDEMVLHAYRSSDGVERWTSRLDAGAGNAMSSNGLAVAPNGTVAVAGQITRSQSPLGPPSQNRYDAVTAMFTPMSWDSFEPP